MPYYKSQLLPDLISYRGTNKELMLSFYNNGQSVVMESYPLEGHWFENQGYEEITRTEFMEAYLPIAEKMNNKIGEL